MDFTQNLTTNFTLGEFFVTNVSGGQAGLYNDLMTLSANEREQVVKNIKALAGELQIVRNTLHRPIFITSGWRSARVNKAVKGASRSQHLYGKAVDIEVVGMTPQQVQKALDHRWNGGLGYGKTFTHLDIRPYRARFTY